MMKRIMWLMVIVLAASCKKGEDNGTTQPPVIPPPKKDTLIIPAAGYEAATSYAGYTLAWSDEFNGTGLSLTDWTYENGEGCPGLCGWGNNELEYYTSSSENLFFKEGKMIIKAKKETYGGKNYTSARIKTQGKRSFKFGRVDIRAVLPVGKGIWPALWMMPQNNSFGNWPASGEIDLMEYLGHEPAKVYSTVHYGPGPGSTSISRSNTLTTGGFNDRFHVFSFIWEQDKMQFLVDDIVFSTVNRSDLGADNYPFNENFYFIINLAVGGNWPGNPDSTTIFSQHFIIDYIRIYQ